MPDRDSSTIRPIPEAQRQQVIGYLKHQAAKSDDDLVALLERGRARLDAALDGVTEDAARFRPDPSAWSIRDVLIHVDTSLRHHAGLVRALAHGGATEPYHPDPTGKDTGEPLAVLRSRVAAGWDAARDAVRSLGAGTADAAAHHPLFGDLTCRQWAAFIYVHCGADHSGQVEQIKAAPGYPA